MGQTIALKIDVTKADKSAFFHGKNGAIYLDVIVMLKDEPDQYGNDGMVVQGIPKERREAGERGAILGNAKIIGGGSNKPKPKPSGGRRLPEHEPVTDSEIPF